MSEGLIPRLLKMLGIAETGQSSEPTASPFAGKTFVFTGELSSMKRADAQKLVEQLGGSCSGSVSKRTNFVVVGSDPGSKLQKARELGITILNEQQFLAMVKSVQSQTPSDRVRCRAIRALGLSGDPNALEPLLQVLNDPVPVVRITAAEAMGWLGNPRAFTALAAVLDSDAPFPLKRSVAESLRRLGHQPTIVQIRQEAERHINATLDSIGDEIAGPAVLEICVQKDPTFLEAMYDMDDASSMRRSLLSLLATLPFQQGLWTQIKSIFKRAELREDDEVWGLLAYRFEATRANPVPPVRWEQVGEGRNRRWVARRDNPVYTAPTQQYLRRRAWRMLRQIARRQPERYARVAAEMLKHFKDSDARDITRNAMTVFVRNTQGKSWSWEWNTAQRQSVRVRGDYVQRVTCKDRYSSYWTFNHVLYRNSPRYQYALNSWRCIEGYDPDTSPKPAEREEAYPTLWEGEAAAEPLFDLLRVSECAPVQEFAVKVVRAAHWDRAKSLSRDALLTLLNKPYDATRSLALDIARAQFDPAAPDRDLILTLARSEFAEARQLAAEWIMASAAQWVEDTEFITELCESSDDNLRQAAKKVIGQLVNWSIGVEWMNRLLAWLLREEPSQGFHAFVVVTLREIYWDALADLPADRVHQLLDANSPDAQEFSGALLTHSRHIKPEELPWTFLATLCHHDLRQVREAGHAMTQQTLPRWRDDVSLLLTLVDSDYEDTRNFAFDVLRQHFTQDMTPDTLIGLCDSIRADVQDFGKEMFRRVFADTVAPEYLLRLSEHPHGNVRGFAMELVERHAPRDAETLMRLMPFFRTALLQVNKGRAVKDRALKFLESCALADREAATIIVPLFSDMAHSLTQRDFTASLLAMTRIKMKYSGVECGGLQLANVGGDKA
jgi:hypothetical protein